MNLSRHCWCVITLTLKWHRLLRCCASWQHQQQQSQQQLQHGTRQLHASLPELVLQRSSLHMLLLLVVAAAAADAGALELF
jgi:hypothetical protein